MILKRLYELAERNGLLDDPAFEGIAVPFVVNIDSLGGYLGIIDCREAITVPSAKGPPKSRQGKGREIAIPKPHGNTANAGFARFFCDTLARVLPVSDEAKCVASRGTFWEQIGLAATETADPALNAVYRFGERLQSDPPLALAIQQDLLDLKPGPGDRCTFKWHPDEGKTILDRDAVRNWWRQYYARFDKGRQNSGRKGVCQVTGEFGPIAVVHANKISGIPDGIASGSSIVSNDKAAFESYGLEGAANAGIGYRAADGYTRAIQALIQQKLCKSRVSIGSSLFLFWTREPSDLNDVFAALMDGTDPAMVEKLLRSPLQGRNAGTIKSNAFYCLTVSANSARVVIRDYLEAPLAVAHANLVSWFKDLQICDAWGKEIVTVFPMRLLALATAWDLDHVLPGLMTQLMEAAIKGFPLADHILAACLRRLQAEGSEGFTPTRLGLIKLFLIRKGFQMDNTLDQSSVTPAYLCGRLMATFERIQWGAMPEVNATVVDRFYGTTSTSPGMVLPRLFKSAQQHLNKLSGEKPGMAENLKKDLESLCSQINAFPNLLTLSQQGEFALGFYHQRAFYRKGREAVPAKAE